MVGIFFTGNSLDGTTKRQEHLSRFSMPDLSKDSGMNVSEKSNMGTLNSSMQFRSTESLTSAPRPFFDLGVPVPLKYPPMQYWDPPRGLGFQEKGKGRAGLAGSMGNMHVTPVMEQRAPPRPRRPNEQEPRGTRQRHRTGGRHHHHHHHGQHGHHGHHHHHGQRQSRRSRSDNALHLAAQGPGTGGSGGSGGYHGDPGQPHFFREDFHERFPLSRASRELFAGGNLGGYRQQFYPRPCPRTTSDLTLQNPGGGSGAQGRAGPYLNGYGEGEEEGDEEHFCSTCSSSTEESADEGYFLGEPIPRPVQLRYLDNEELRHRYSPTALGGRGQLHTRRRRKSKNCSIS